MTKQLVRLGAAVMTTLLALVVLWQFRIVIVYLLISLTFAATLRPLINSLRGRGIVLRIVLMLLYLIGLIGFGYLLFLAGWTAIKDIQQLGYTVSEQDEWRLPLWLEGSSFQQSLVTQLPPPSTLFKAITGDKGQLVLPALLGFTQDIAGIVSGGLIVLFLSLYWIVNQNHFERLWLSLLPSAQRKQARDIWRTIEPDLGAYIRSQLIHSLLAGVLFGLGYWVLGSPYPTLLALTGALACLIPVAGVVLPVIPPLLIGLLTGVQHSLFTVLYTLVILIVLGIWIKPRLFDRKWDNPILTLVILIAMANAFGLIGIIIAPPISAIFQVLWSLLVSHRLVSGDAKQISDLKERQESIQSTISEMGEPALPLVVNSMERLTRLIEKAEPILRAALAAEPSGQLSPIKPEPEQEKNRGHTQNS
ncbi:MAG: hypothetical protein CVU39_11960 [Chloroflexi bacterium HGW-Chloroflexi-10]|nr:MAG: hypothetical protein CVU39_11960 [Chloroflexi bacterium HGW-Chloroflexi-10]